MKEWEYALRDLQLIKTQQEIAKEAGLSQTYVSLLLKNARKNPSYEIARKIIEIRDFYISEINNKKSPVASNN